MCFWHQAKARAEAEAARIKQEAEVRHTQTRNLLHLDPNGDLAWNCFQTLAGVVSLCKLTCVLICMLQSREKILYSRMPFENESSHTDVLCSQYDGNHRAQYTLRFLTSSSRISITDINLQTRKQRA